MLQQLNFIDLRMKDTNELIREIHYYIKWQAPLDIESMSREDVFKVSSEAMRVTVRITRIMGWLMLQKAVLCGELSRQAIFSDKLRILEGGSCLETSSENDSQLPTRLRELLKKSRELYVQTMRLEEISLKPPPLPEEIKKKGVRNCYLIPSVALKKNTGDS